MRWRNDLARADRFFQIDIFCSRGGGDNFRNISGIPPVLCFGQGGACTPIAVGIGRSPIRGGFYSRYDDSRQNTRFIGGCRIVYAGGRQIPAARRNQPAAALELLVDAAQQIACQPRGWGVKDGLVFLASSQAFRVDVACVSEYAVADHLLGVYAQFNIRCFFPAAVAERAVEG